MPKPGYKQTPQHRERIAEALRGHKVSEETRAKMSASGLAAWERERERVREVLGAVKTDAEVLDGLESEQTT